LPALAAVGVQLADGVPDTLFVAQVVVV
jgi:hypothetical protein